MTMSSCPELGQSRWTARYLPLGDHDRYVSSLTPTHPASGMLSEILTAFDSSGSAT
ncbi:MAG: hypothetical protein U0V56_02560 [Actinomycetota bacterium]